MPAKRTPFDLDDAIRRYESGESVRKIATALGVGHGPIERGLREAGVYRTRDASWIAEAVKLYESGMSQSEIGERFGRHQATVSAALLRRGVATRDASESGRIRASRQTSAQRAAQAAAAHDAIRGTTRTLDDLERRALGKQAAMSHATDEELAFARRLSELGIETIPQQAISKYNVDIGASPVAVELFGGGWHAYGRHADRMPQRIEDIADAGWNMLIIWSASVRLLDIDAVAKDVVAYIEQSRRDPSFRRQYRVIWGDGQFHSSGSVDDDYLALVPPSIRRPNSARD